MHLFAQERASMEQQHTKAFLNGTGGPPEMQEQDRKGGLLRDMQNFITSRNQVIFPIVVG